eukprot:scaffold428_cov105-Isochrysis_galbana.AAC.2
MHVGTPSERKRRAGKGEAEGKGWASQMIPGKRRQVGNLPSRGGGRASAHGAPAHHLLHKMHATQSERSAHSAPGALFFTFAPTCSAASMADLKSTPGTSPVLRMSSFKATNTPASGPCLPTADSTACTLSAKLCGLPASDGISLTFW